MSKTNFTITEWSQLVGGTIIEIVVGDSRAAKEVFGEALISFDVKMPDGKIFNVQPFSDEEGNGQGFLGILEIGE